MDAARALRDGPDRSAQAHVGPSRSDFGNRIGDNVAVLEEGLTAVAKGVRLAPDVAVDVLATDAAGRCVFVLADPGGETLVARALAALAEFRHAAPLLALAIPALGRAATGDELPRLVLAAPRFSERALAMAALIAAPSVACVECAVVDDGKSSRLVVTSRTRRGELAPAAPPRVAPAPRARRPQVLKRSALPAAAATPAPAATPAAVAVATVPAAAAAAPAAGSPAAAKTEAKGAKPESAADSSKPIVKSELAKAVAASPAPVAAHAPIPPAAPPSAKAATKVQTAAPAVDAPPPIPATPAASATPTPTPTPTATPAATPAATARVVSAAAALAKTVAASAARAKPKDAGTDASEQGIFGETKLRLLRLSPDVVEQEDGEVLSFRVSNETLATLTKDGAGVTVSVGGEGNPVRVHDADSLDTAMEAVFGRFFELSSLRARTATAARK